MRKEKLETGHIYHILNRGVEKRSIFQNEKDYLRFVHDLYDFNDKSPAENINYKADRLNSYEVGPRKERKPIVKILAFNLRPNHYHLLLEQTTNNGVTNFMRKLGTGYTMYFNKKYDRVGPLFQGKFKSVLIKKDRQLNFIPHYIHLNSLDPIMPEWREGKIKNKDKVLLFLKKYRWSSYNDYVGDKNFPNIIQPGFILGLFGGSKHYQRDLIDWLDNVALENIRHQTLENS